MKRSYRVFVDTNIFIQLRDLATLPWRDLLPDAAEIAIMVARPVVEELDRFKTSPRDRLRKRSRFALGLLDAAAEAPGRELLLRDKPVRISLCIAPRKSLDWSRFPDFDPSSADDRLVAAAAMSGDDAILLSHDRGPRFSAGEIGLAALAPPEVWHLDDEPTEEDQKVARLERQLSAAVSRGAKLAIVFPDAVDAMVIVPQPLLEPLPADLQARLVELVVAANPRAPIKAKLANLYHLYGGLSEGQVMAYDGNYAQYRTAVERYLERIHERLMRHLSLPRLRFEIVNSGSASAARLVAQMDAEGFEILPGPKSIVRAIGTLDLPQPPAVPRPSVELLLERVERSPFPVAGPRDPTEMRWLHQPQSMDHKGSLGCDDFRPGRTYAREIGLRAQGTAAHRFCLAVSANDVAELRTEVGFAAEVPALRAWTDPDILSHLPASVAEVLLSSPVRP